MVRRLVISALVAAGVIGALIAILFWLAGDIDDDELIKLSFTGRM